MNPNAAVSPAQEQIHEAIRQGDSTTAMALLEADERLVRAGDRDGSTPLHAAAQAGNLDMVAWLLDRKASVRQADIHGLTPLDRAALAAGPHFSAVARRLTDAGAEVTIRGAVALADAARIRELVGRDAGLLGRDIHWARGGLLTLAVRHGRLETVRLLLDLGADADERTTLEELEEPTASWGGPLWHAAQAGRKDIAQLLLDRGADPNANVYASGWPLDHAYRRQDRALKELLLERGARPQPWTVAMAHDPDEAGRMLAADAGEDVARELAWSAACNGCPEMVAMALPRLTWPAGDPRWHHILIQPLRGTGDGEEAEPYLACMRLLLEHGIDPNVPSRFGQTALHFAAARNGWSETVRGRFAGMLLDHGARLDVRDELLRSTPLGWASRWGRREMVELLIARGAPVAEPDAEAWATPLAWATKMGHNEIAGVLRQKSE